jgi:hypothetical protein
LRTPGGQLCGHKIGTANEERLEAGVRVDHTLNPPFPCGVEIDAGDIGKNIEAMGIAPKTKETAALREVFWTNALERCFELGERGIRRSFAGAAFMKRSISFVKRGCA